MKKRGIIAIVVSIIVGMFTPIGLYVYVIPFIVGCMGGKKVRKFYFNFFFEQDDRD